MARFRFRLAALLAAACLPAAGQAEELYIADNAALVAAVAEGMGGRDVLLAPGTYDPILLDQEAVPDSLRSADPDNPAVLLGLIGGSFDGFTIENLILDYRYDPADAIHVRPFRFGGCRNLVMRGNRFVGDVARGRSAADNGYGWGIGLAMGGCDNVLIENNYFSDFHRGMTFGSVSGLVVRGNELTQLRMDGMNFSQATDVVIENNHIHNFNRSLDSEDHADMIQFWTTQTTRISRDIVIRGNILNSGAGYFTQSIFMRNELADTGRAGREMYYRNILIEDNVIINAHLHGITVGETIDLTIRNNTLAQNIGSITGWPRPDDHIWLPTIRVAEDAVGVRIEDNLAWRVIGHTGQTGWRVARNLRIQNRSLMDPAHYTQIFQGYPNGDPGSFETYLYRPGGPAADGGLGAALLRR